MRAGTLIRTALLMVGGGIIVASAIHTLSHLSDRTVFTVLVPGFAAGLFLIGLYVRTGRGEEG